MASTPNLNHSIDETTRLLGDAAVQERQSDHEGSRSGNGVSHDEPQETFIASQKITIVLAGLFTIFFQFAFVLMFTPSLRLFEIGLCRDYYLHHDPSLVDPDGNVPESRCKVNEIQEDLSGLKAWVSSLEGIVGLLLVLPYGHLAQKKGARLIAILNLLGFALSTSWILIVCYFWRTLSIRLVILSPLFRAVGGGSPITSAVTLALVANAAPPSRRATMFFFMGSAELLTEMTAPILSTYLLYKEFLYLPILLSFLFEALAFVAILLLPVDTQTSASKSVNSNDSTADNTEHASNSSPLWPRLVSALTPPEDMRQRDVLILLGSFATTKLGRQMLEMLVQYTTKRYGWSWGRANLLFSFRALGSLALMLFVLPPLKWLLQRNGANSHIRVDFSIAVASTIALILGSIGMGLAASVPIFLTSLAIFTLGGGGREALQSFLTSLVSIERIAKLYTFVALADGLGTALGAALVNGALKEGIHRGAAWIGLPLFVATGAYCLSLAGLLLARPSSGKMRI